MDERDHVRCEGEEPSTVNLLGSNRFDGRRRESAFEKLRNAIDSGSKVVSGTHKMDNKRFCYGKHKGEDRDAREDGRFDAVSLTDLPGVAKVAVGWCLGPGLWEDIYALNKFSLCPVIHLKKF